MRVTKHRACRGSRYNVRMTTHQGSCLCGAVRFEVQGDFERFYLCHCSRCRKDTGSAHAANLFGPAVALTWLAGQQNVTTYTVPGARHAKAFCATCGSAMPRPMGAGFVVPAGSLDSALVMRPTAHIFVASRAAWDHELETVERHDTISGTGKT